MEKKILVGSIKLTVMLTLVSFTSIVGLPTIKPNSEKASPLFSIKTKRAVGEESKVKPWYNNYADKYK